MIILHQPFSRSPPCRKATAMQPDPTCCSPTARTPLLTHLGQQLAAHADRDGLTGVRRAVFLDRGGHAPGETCPTEPAQPPDPHTYWCGHPDEPCGCGAAD